MIKNFLTLLFFFPLIVYSQDLILVDNPEGKYGFVDKYGDTIIDCKYDYAENFSGGLALVKNNLRYKLVDTTGMLHDLDKYDSTAFFRHDMGEYHSGLPIIKKLWNCAYISSGGDVYLDLPYQDATSFFGGKAKVIDGDRYNYISKNGLLLGSWRMIEDDYHAIKKDDKFGYIDRNGKLKIDYRFENAKDFEDGFAQISNGKFWAVIDKSGERISDWYEEIESFNGKTAIVKKLGNIGFINREGKFMEQWYKSIEPLEFGLYKVKKYEQFAIVNNDGYLVTQWFDKIYHFEDGYIKVKKGDKYAYLNRIGALVVGWYDNIGEVKNGLIRISDEDKYAFYSVEKYFTSDFYDYLGNFNDGLAIVKKDGKFGYVNTLGNLVIDPQYDDATPFHGGLAQVEKDNKAAYINKDGKVQMGWFESKKYIFEEPPRGLIAVKFGRKYGFQTLNGRRVISAKFNYAENFNNGLALVKNNPKEMYITKSGKLKPLSTNPDNDSLRRNLGYGYSGDPVKITVWECAYIDYNGDIVFNLDDKATDAYSFDNKKAKIVKADKYNYINLEGEIIGEWKEFPDDYHAAFKNGKFGYINKNGQKVIDYKFNYAYDFKDGIAKVRIGSRTTGKRAYINRKGEFITKKYDQISDFENSIAVAELNGKFVLVDTSGKEITDWYDKIHDFSEQIAVVEQNGKFSYVNYKGYEFDKWFDEADDFKGGRAKVKIHGKWGFVNRKGKVVVRADYEDVWNYQNNIAKVEKNGKYAFIDLNGKLITEWFDRIFFFSDERAVIVKDGKWGYIDVTGRIVIKPVYDRAFAFSGGEALVVSEGEMVKIDKEGNFIKEE